MPVYAPWPISTCFAITVTLSSAPTRRKAFGANVPPGACAAIARRDVPAHSKPIVSARAAAVPAPFRKVRRDGR